VETSSEPVAENTHRLEIRIPDARYIFSVYLLAEAEPILIEPGPASLVPSILQEMDRLGMGGLSLIIPTHIHMDHGGGTGTLAREFPEAKIILHPRAVRHALDPARLVAGTAAVYGDDFEKLYGPVLPIPEDRIIAAKDGDRVGKDARRLRILHTPGHAFHHLSIYDEKTRGLFCGEALGLPTMKADAITLPAISVGDLDVERYLTSIEKLRQLNPELIFYPHDGGAVPPGNCFSRIAENTEMLRDVILAGIRKDEPDDAIQKAILNRLSVTHTPADMSSVIAGYRAYFEWQGIR